MSAVPLTEQTRTDIAYLNEYVDFGANGSIVVTELLHKAFIEAAIKKDFDQAAHLQLRLVAEMVMCLEAVGAMLNGYMRWDKDGGVLGGLLNYKPHEVPQFMRQLKDAGNSVLNLLCLPSCDAVLTQVEAIEDEAFVEAHYTDQMLHGIVDQLCELYLSDVVHQSYNKLKHGYPVVRSPLIFDLNIPTVSTKSVCIIAGKKMEETINAPGVSFPVVGIPGFQTALKCVNNVRVSVNSSVTVAKFVARCLQLNLMKPSAVGS